MYPSSLFCKSLIYPLPGVSAMVWVNVSLGSLSITVITSLRDDCGVILGLGWLGPEFLAYGLWYSP